jgi:hypothetical protein
MGYRHAFCVQVVHIFSEFLDAHVQTMTSPIYGCEDSRAAQHRRHLCHSKLQCWQTKVGTRAYPPPTPERQVLVVRAIVVWCHTIVEPLCPKLISVFILVLWAPPYRPRVDNDPRPCGYLKPAIVAGLPTDTAGGAGAVLAGAASVPP